MSLAVLLTQEAENDFDAVADWDQERAGLGAKCTIHGRNVLSRIGQMPELHGVLHQDIRRAKAQRFPYNVYFRLRADRVEVVAILHGRRDTSVWRKRT